MRLIIKYTYFTLLIVLFSCQNTKPIIINATLNPKIDEDFRNKDLENLYPKLITPQNFDPNKDAVLLEKIKKFQKKLITVLKSEKINWNIGKTKLPILTRIYFDKTGKIEYFAFKINNNKVRVEAIKEFSTLLEKNINKISIDVKRKTKYNHCINFKILTE